jgi:hypothetical protein
VPVETKFLRLNRPAVVGQPIDGLRVCWVGGWDKGRVLWPSPTAPTFWLTATVAGFQVSGKRSSDLSLGHQRMET